MILIQRLSIILVLLSIYSQAKAQSGLSVSPPRNYFTVASGQNDSKKVLVSNPSKTTRLDLAVSLNDWTYDTYGNNVIHDAGTQTNSCANWIAIPQSFFSLAPGESYEMELIVTPPTAPLDDLAVHTAMLYITQVNPESAVDEQGANIKVSVRTGIKIYHRYPGPRFPQLDITNFKYVDSKKLELEFSNTGNVWADGTLSCELINQESGKKITLPDTVFYSMPKDQRKVNIALAEKLAKGKYIATALLNYGEDVTIKMAELNFTHE